MAFEVRSNTGGGLLTVRRHGDANRDGSSTYVATVRAGSLAASVGFYELSIDPFTDLLRRAAIDWRGWKGERAWQSLEGEFSVGLTHDQLGTVDVWVRLAEAYATDREWSAEALLQIDAGALDRVARDARALRG